jgi:hypothetical protein
MPPTKLESFAGKIGEDTQLKMRRDEKLRELGRDFLMLLKQH